MVSGFENGLKLELGIDIVIDLMTSCDVVGPDNTQNDKIGKKNSDNKK